MNKNHVTANLGDFFTTQGISLQKVKYYILVNMNLI